MHFPSLPSAHYRTLQSLRFHEELDERIDAIVPIKKFSQLQASDRVQLVGASINTVRRQHLIPRVSPPLIIVTISSCSILTGIQELLTQQLLSLPRSVSPSLPSITLLPLRLHQPERYVLFESDKIQHSHSQSLQIVAGSTDGVVRLFSSPDPEKHIMKRSKTNLNQLADPVKGVEVSSTGEWVVWTTKEYIAVVNTTFTDKNNNVNNGFIKSMGDSRPDALILRLSPEDMARHGIEEVNFTSARFDNGPYIDPSGANVIEEEIVASTGQFLVRWKFRLVKLDYARSRESSERAAKPMIYRQQETIVDKTFEYGSNHVVAALQSDLSVLSFDDDE